MSNTSASSPTVWSTSLLSRSKAPSPLRYEREKGARCFSALSLPQLLLGGMAVCAGIVTVYVGSLSPAFPFVIGADIISGITTIFAGGVAYKISKENLEPKKLRSQVRCNIFLYGFLTILCLCLSFLSIGAAAYGIHLCTMEDTSDGLMQKEPNPCQTRRRASLALSVTDIVLEIFICVVNIVGFWVFANYRFAYGCFTYCDDSQQSTGNTKPKSTRKFGNSKRQTVSSGDSPKLTSLSQPNFNSGMVVPINVPGGMTFTSMYDDIEDPRISRPAQRIRNDPDMSRNSRSDRDLSKQCIDYPNFSLARPAQRNCRSDNLYKESIDSPGFIVSRNSRSERDVAGFSPRLTLDVAGFSPRLTSDVAGFSPRPTSDVARFSPRLTSDVAGFSPRPTSDVARFSPRLTSDVARFSPRPTSDVARFSPRPTSDVARFSPRLTSDVAGFSPRLTSERRTQRARSDRDLNKYGINFNTSGMYGEWDSSKFILDGMILSHLQSDVDSGQSSDRRGQSLYGGSHIFRKNRHEKAHSCDSSNVGRYVDRQAHRHNQSKLESSDTFYNGAHSRGSASPLTYADSEILY